MIKSEDGMFLLFTSADLIYTYRQLAEDVAICSKCRDIVANRREAMDFHRNLHRLATAFAEKLRDEITEPYDWDSVLKPPES